MKIIILIIFISNLKNIFDSFEYQKKPKILTTKNNQRILRIPKNHIMMSKEYENMKLHWKIKWQSRSKKCRYIYIQKIKKFGKIKESKLTRNFYYQNNLFK